MGVQTQGPVLFTRKRYVLGTENESFEHVLVLSITVDYSLDCTCYECLGIVNNSEHDACEGSLKMWINIQFLMRRNIRWMMNGFY